MSEMELVPVESITAATMEIDNALSQDSQIGFKYTAAAEICTHVLSSLIQNCRPGTSVVELCKNGDEMVDMLCNKVYQKNSAMERGVAYPVTVCVNNTVSGMSPLLEDLTQIEEGDSVKIELAVHLDGYIVSSAWTSVVYGHAPSQPLTGRLADCICASYLASELLIKKLVPGTDSQELVDIIERVCTTYRVRPIEGPMVYLAKRFVPASSEKTVTYDETGIVDNEFVVQPDDVYVVSVCMTSGDGKMKESSSRPTILCRNVSETSVGLKLKSARAAFSIIDGNSSVFPFSLREYTDPAMRLGIQECTQKALLQMIPTFRIQKQDSVAQYKNTIIVKNEGSVRLTGYPHASSVPYVHSEFNLPLKLQQMLL